MKVIQVLNHFLPQQTAGTEIYAWSLSKHLQKMGIDVQVLIPHYGKTMPADYMYDGLKVHQYAEPSLVDRSLILGFRAPDGLKGFISFLKKIKPDIVHFHELAGSNGVTVQHVRAAKIHGAKVIMTFHLATYSCKAGTLYYKGKVLCDGKIDSQKCSRCYLHTRGYTTAAPYLTAASVLLKQLSIDASKWNCTTGTALGMIPIIDKLQQDLNALVSACDRVVALTKWYRSVLLKNGIDKDKISYIPQALPLKTNFETTKRKVTNKPLRLVFLGRINPFKGLHLLIDAITGIDPTLVQLSIFGNADDVAYETNLRFRTREMKNVFWCGKLKQEEVISTLCQHDMLCICSTFSEMSPLVIQEAFAAGIPVLASDVYGNADQIQHEHNGLLFQFNNIVDLRHQIHRSINEPELPQKLGNNIQPPRSFEEVGSDYFGLYKSMLN
jgi:glycosyltransferase involved in cell wall biosynthesis